MKSALQILVKGLQDFECFCPVHPLGRQVFLCFESRARTVLMQDFLNVQRKLLTVHSVQLDFQERPNEFRASGCRQESRQSIPRGLGIPLWNRSEHPLLGELWCYGVEMGAYMFSQALSLEPTHECVGTSAPSAEGRQVPHMSWECK